MERLPNNHQRKIPPSVTEKFQNFPMRQTSSKRWAWRGAMMLKDWMTTKCCCKQPQRKFRFMLMAMMFRRCLHRVASKKLKKLMSSWGTSLSNSEWKRHSSSFRPSGTNWRPLVNWTSLLCQVSLLSTLKTRICLTNWRTCKTNLMKPELSQRRPVPLMTS